MREDKAAYLVKEFIHTLQQVCLFSGVVGNIVEVLGKIIELFFYLDFTLSAIRVDIDRPIS